MWRGQKNHYLSVCDCRFNRLQPGLVRFDLPVLPLADSPTAFLLIQTLGELGDYAGMFAAVLIVALIGFAADRFYVAWMGHMLRWRKEAE